MVARDNTVTWDGVVMQLAKQVGRRTCAGLHVLVRRHLNGQHSVWLGSRRLGLFDARGRARHRGRRVTLTNRAGFRQGEIAGPSTNPALRGCKLTRGSQRPHPSGQITVSTEAAISLVNDTDFFTGGPPR